MLFRLVENYVKNMKEVDVKNFAFKNGIILNDEETLYITNTIKKDYRTIIYGNPENIFSELRKKFSYETVAKAEQLYLDFKNKYINYL